jgi:rubrerythrin
MELNKDLAKNLISLVQLDIDAIHAYRQAIKEIDVPEISDNLIRFQQDHENHVKDLNEIIIRLGAESPVFKPDFKGFIIEGFTALRSQLGNEGALKAMRGNEKLANSTYDKALGWEMPPDIRSVIEKNRDDERRHLAYIENALTLRTFERRDKIA